VILILGYKPFVILSFKITSFIANQRLLKGTFSLLDMLFISGICITLYAIFIVLLSTLVSYMPLALPLLINFYSISITKTYIRIFEWYYKITFKDVV
jgi:hypothetical protein